MSRIFEAMSLLYHITSVNLLTNSPISLRSPRNKKTKVACSTHNLLLAADIGEHRKRSELVYGNGRSSCCFSLNITNDNLVGGSGFVWLFLFCDCLPPCTRSDPWRGSASELTSCSLSIYSKNTDRTSANRICWGIIKNVEALSKKLQYKPPFVWLSLLKGSSYKIVGLIACLGPRQSSGLPFWLEEVRS